MSWLKLMNYPSKNQFWAKILHQKIHGNSLFLLPQNTYRISNSKGILACTP